MNYCVSNDVARKYTICKNFAEFFECLSSDKIADGIVEVFFNGKYVEISLESLLEGDLRVTGTSNLCLNFMNYMSFRISESKKNPPPNDKALLYSLDVVLKAPGVTEKNRLKSCIRMVNSIKDKSEKYFYTPFLNVCQSSGSGKTKIATELILDMPSLYFVLREKAQDPDTLKMHQFGYPFMSSISELFLTVPLDLKNDASNSSEIASESIVGRYLLLLKALFSDYLDVLRVESSNLPFESALKTLYQQLIDGTFKGEDLILGIKKYWEDIHINRNTSKFQKTRNSETIPITIKNVITTCHTLLKDIDALRNSALKEVKNILVIINLIRDGNLIEAAKLLKKIDLTRTACSEEVKKLLKDGKLRGKKDLSKIIEPIQQAALAFEENYRDNPLVMIIDEASLLCSKCSKTGLSLFRLFRRAVNSLGRNCNFVVLTLGTNSDVLDLNPDLSVDSFRESIIGKTFPPFILSRNWDVFLDYDELEKSPIGYNQMLNGRIMIFWASLGRPVWSSISLTRLSGVVRTKICNRSVETGEALLAFWMVRVGLLINPAHVVTQHLVKSLMGTLLYVSNNLRNMRVYYPSEPILAVEISSMLSESYYFEKYYAALEKFIKNRAIDTGRFSEIISADICLLAIAKSKRLPCSWKYDESLPKICEANHFIFENSEFHSPENQKKVQEEIIEPEMKKANNVEDKLSKLFASKYIITEGIEFVRSLYGLIDNGNENISNLINVFVPKLMKSALLNMSHYTQVSTRFPFETFEKGFNDDLQMTVPPIADPKYEKNNGYCNQITAEVLETMIMRGTGLMLAPNTFGLDHVIPVCMKPATFVGNTKPEYSFIGVQVKRGTSTNIRKIVSKGAVSNHYVRCGLSGSKCCECDKNTCKFRIPYDHYKRILENGFMLVHSMTDDEINFNDDDDEIVEPVKNVKRSKIDSQSYIFKCETSLAGAKEQIEKLQALKKQLKENLIRKDIFFERKKVIDDKLKEIVKYLCPEEFIDNLDQFEFQEYKASNYDGCRFIPDLYIEVRASKELSLHCMVKSREDGINEKIVAIYSKGMESFSYVLPARSREIARRIIFNDISVFDEVDYDYDPKKDDDVRPPIKYTELITGVVSRNNNSSIPIANNFIRHKYGLPLIPDHLPDYETVTFETIDKLL